MPKKEVIFDCETKKIFSEIATDDPGDLGVSIVSVYSRTVEITEKDGRTIINETAGKMESFWEEDFVKMWPIFQNADRIIGFNSIGFDVPALKPYTNFPFEKLPHFDIMYKFKDVAGHRISLDALAKETLDKEKIDVGLNAVLYWKKHDKESLAKLKKYCEEDVYITRDIYDFAYNKGQLLFKDKWNTLRKIDLDFSYTKEERKIDQIGLF
jgi:DEAD/DEAH box helicase domain-containing protein